MYQAVFIAYLTQGLLLGLAALALLAAFPGDLSPLITHRHPLAEWEQCFTELRDQQGIKGLITIG